MVTAYVLAGGASSRMGSDKAAVKVEGQSLLQIAVAKAKAVCEEVFILCGEDASRAGELAPAVLDLRPGCGPLSGVEAALAHTQSEWSLFLPVDTPAIPVVLLRRWKERVEWKEDKDRAVVLAVSGDVQALPVFFPRGLLPRVSQAIDEKRYRLSLVAPMEAMEVADLVALSTPRTEMMDWFTNLNTPQDLAQWKDRLQGKTKT